MELSEPTILAPRQELVAARAGGPAGANDPFFAEFKASLPIKVSWSPPPMISSPGPALARSCG
jgi:hypothetical protein